MAALSAVSASALLAVAGLVAVSCGPVTSHPQAVAVHHIPAPVLMSSEHQRKRQKRSRTDNFRQNDEEPKRFLRATAAPAPFGSVVQFGGSMLQCEFIGNPAPSVDWLFDGRLIRQADLTETLEEQTNSLDALVWSPANVMAVTRSRLYLDCVTQRNQGIYTCQGQTGFQSESLSTTLYVEDEVNKEGMATCERLKDVAFRPARIVQWRPRILSPIGSRARLVCQTEGFPTPRVVWRKDDNVITGDGNRITVEPTGDLVLDPLMWSDMGVYYCSASNEISSDQVDTFIYPFKA